MKQKKQTQAQLLAKMQVKIEELEANLQYAIRLSLEGEVRLQNLTKMIFDVTKEEQDAE
jgi:hypothetical protein